MTMRLMEKDRLDQAHGDFKLPMNKPRRVICAFYASTTYGSEYRAGLEFIQFAAAIGFDLAIIADLENNDSAEKLQSIAPGIRVVRIPSPIKKQVNLYRYSDLLAQTIWHLRVSHWLRKEIGKVECLWIQNGASPWLPLVNYFDIAPLLVWGPVGGGEPATRAMMLKLPWRVRLREMLRSNFERRMLKRKFAAAGELSAPRLVAMARTIEAQMQLRGGLGDNIPVIPEILEPLDGVHIPRRPQRQPRLIWVGQDIPRKNLRLSLELFRVLRSESFPGATLDVFGCNAPDEYAIEGVTYHGWVPRVEWQSFSDSGVLLLTSFREGLPSTVLEAIRHGLLCISSDVGAIGRLGINTVLTLPKEEYPDYSTKTVQAIAERIHRHLHSSFTEFDAVSYRQDLMQYLKTEGVLT